MTNIGLGFQSRNFTIKCAGHADYYGMSDNPGIFCELSDYVVLPHGIADSVVFHHGLDGISHR